MVSDIAATQFLRNGDSQNLLRMFSFGSLVSV